MQHSREMQRSDSVVIVPHSSVWVVEFERERQALLSAFAPRQFIIEHIGSTAVRGLPAKPIIDIMLGAATLSEIEACTNEICSLGYEYIAEYECEIPERRYFVK